MILKRKMEGTFQPEDNLSFELQLEGTFEGVRTALAHMMAHLQGLHLAHEIRENIELVMAEVLNNIAEHGFTDLPQPGSIRVCCSKAGAELACRVTDFGQAMPNLALPATAALQERSQLQEVEIDALPEGGFGWALIHELTREVTYQRCGPMNALTLTFPLAEQQYR